MSETSFIKGLYLVATPIGNLGDISLRALEVLKASDVIACEDTRQTGKLLLLLGISGKRLISYHDHNAQIVGESILERLRKGERVALVSDAGTPLISDPGYRLVQSCLEEELYVTALPGASALLTALQLSGLPSHRFLFEGFLPNKKTARRKTLLELKSIPATLIFYESPKRLKETLKDMLFVLGNCRGAVLRELTKKFEQTIRGSLEELVNHYEESGNPKGEIVIVIDANHKEGFKEGDGEDGSLIEKEEEEKEITALLKQALETMRVKEASNFISKKTGRTKKEIYKLALRLKDDV